MRKSKFISATFQIAIDTYSLAKGSITIKEASFLPDALESPTIVVHQI